MRAYMRIGLATLLAALTPLFLTGCDGEGLVVSSKVYSNDQTPDQGGDNPNPIPTPGQPDTRFSGSWFASFGDDFATSLTSRGAMEYSALLKLTQSNATITGSGTMYRFFRQGTQAFDRQTFTVTGTASGSDATVTLQPSQTGTFDALPLWYLRLSGSRLVGMFQETNNAGDLIRAGHADWFRSASGVVDGAWVSAAPDHYATTGNDRRDRTGTVSLALNSDNTIAGQGAFDVQTGSTSAIADFNVTRGIYKTPDLDFTFGDLDLAGNEMDWLGFFAGSTMPLAYAQFDSSNQMIRLGHATWYRGVTPDLNAVTAEWDTAFEDSVTAGNVPATDYLLQVTLRAVNGGGVTGSGTMRIVGDTEQSVSVAVANGNLLGSRLQLELRSPGRTFFWDLRAAGSLLVGSYRQVNASGDFVSHGSAEWRTGTNLNLLGSWAASFFDTFGAQAPESTQTALVTITQSDINGSVAGLGALRFAGDTRRRLFNLAGDNDGNEITWTWQPQDQFGPTIWHLYQAGNYLFGTYVNEDSVGNLEARGKAMWVRTNRTDTITQ